MASDEDGQIEVPVVDSESEENIPRPPSPPPTIGKRKRGRPAKVPVSAPVVTGTLHNTYARLTSSYTYSENAAKDAVVKIMYMTTTLSALEAKKAVSKRVPINESFELSTEEPWDTLKAQLLVKIDNALSPKNLDYQQYHVMFFVPKAGLVKPGLTLSTNEHYTTLLARVRASTNTIPTVNVTIQEKENQVEKENAAATGATGPLASEDANEKQKKVCRLAVLRI